jgi:hypothetical protein
MVKQRPYKMVPYVILEIDQYETLWLPHWASAGLRKAKSLRAGAGSEHLTGLPSRVSCHCSRFTPAVLESARCFGQG